MRTQYQSLDLVDMWATFPDRGQQRAWQSGLTFSGSANPLLEMFDGKEMAQSEERLDYIWVSASTRPGWRRCDVERHAYEYHHSATEVWPASDHFALEATLEL